ncbi:MAG: hypothetical protein AAB645_02385 [Patescibacteria group bacterium]
MNQKYLIIMLTIAVLIILAIFIVPGLFKKQTPTLNFTVPEANPLNNAPDLNPVNKTNPFKNAKTNPFE